MELYLTMELQNTQEDSVHILWFPKALSQDQIDHGCSNACTITALLISLNWNDTNRRIDLSKGCIKYGTEIATILRSSILRGNKIYKNSISSSPKNVINFTIPESAELIGSEMKKMFEWQSGIFLLDLGDSLHESLTEGLSIWEGSKPHWKPMLFVVLTTKNNSVLLVYQEEPKVVILIDTCSHQDKGAVIACVPQTELKALCRWYHCLLRKYFLDQPAFYELSFFYFKN
ncbi:hypothetical protein J437_LFUL012370 [Ladona fulva]|uniref:Uncharacterized protein n=1 Tax=Ladona fulva TaxID=123851 RepID=A0A8K0P3M6_LADFU|nr:hypothetical protein J437_LFUL012370 [Ladona fulva]